MYLDKAKIKQSFAVASKTYDEGAQLQRKVGNALIDKLSPAATVLDLGCGTGFLTSKLSDYAENVIALDIALPMLQVTQKKGLNNARYLCADAEQLPLADHSVDSVVSNLALQWCVNLDVVFSDIKRVLKSDGQLVFSIFGPQTLQELKAAWATVDDFQHVNDFYNPHQLFDFLKRAGFTEISLDSAIYYPSYSSVWALMKELKQIGAHNMTDGRSKKITGKSTMQRMLAAYSQQDDRIVATFEVISVQAR